MRFRLAPRDTRFFPMFIESAQNLVAATDVLAEFVTAGADREELANRLREHEHAGDTVTHRVIHELNSTFVTPFDREDIYQLATLLDDVMDSMEAAADFVVLTKLDGLPTEMTRQVDLLHRAARCTYDGPYRGAVVRSARPAQCRRVQCAQQLRYSIGHQRVRPAVAVGGADSRSAADSGGRSD